MDELYQGLIERTRRLLDVPRLKTIFGRKRRPQAKSKRAIFTIKNYSSRCYRLSESSIWLLKLEPNLLVAIFRLASGGRASRFCSFVGGL
jgi:hypothetical protein